jgi:hypothetical protein
MFIFGSSIQYQFKQFNFLEKNHPIPRKANPRGPVKNDILEEKPTENPIH